MLAVGAIAGSGDVKRLLQESSLSLDRWTRLSMRLRLFRYAVCDRIDLHFMSFYDEQRTQRLEILHPRLRRAR
jgi:hypothetical protein